MELEKAKNGLYTVKVNNRYLHSKYDPLKESEQFINKYSDLFNERVIVVYGIGLGYHIELLLERASKKSKIYVFDYNSDIIKYCKRVNSNLFTNKRINIFSSLDKKFFEEFSKALKYSGNIIIHKPSLESIKDINNKLYLMISNYIISTDSIEKFKNQLKFNAEMNKNQKLLPISSLIAEQKKSDDVIVVSSGPSLDAEISNLKLYRKYFKIIAVGSSLRTLLNNSIIPDIVVIIDCQMIVYNQIRGFENEDIPICFLNTASAKAIEKYNGPKYVFFNDGKEKCENLMTGKTVAVSAMDLAIRCGAKNIIMIGQDLALVNGRSHTNTYKETYGIDDEKNTVKWTEKVKAYDGSIIDTRKSYMLFKIQIENLINKNKSVNFYNCSKGAWIEGSKHTDFIDYIRKKDEKVGK